MHVQKVTQEEIPQAFASESREKFDLTRCHLSVAACPPGSSGDIEDDFSEAESPDKWVSSDMIRRSCNEYDA